MTEEHARKILGNVIDHGDGCYEFIGVSGLIDSHMMHIDVCKWTLEELKAIVWWMENKGA